MFLDLFKANLMQKKKSEIFCRAVLCHCKIFLLPCFVFSKTSFSGDGDRKKKNKNNEKKKKKK